MTARFESSLFLLLVLGCAANEAPPPAPPPPPAMEPAPVVTEHEPGDAEPSRPVESTSPVPAAVAASDRAEADRALDEGRHPVQMFEFFGIQPGMKVADLGAGGGYTSELLARIVGPEGKVYGQNNRFILERFAEKPWSERLQKPVMRNVTRLDTEFDAPFPKEVVNLDFVLNILFYHDTVWMKADRDRMNAAVFQALKAGGIYGIVDHAAREGDGTKEAQTLHRIEEKTLRAEVEKAGFRFVASADFLRNPDDPRDWNAAPSKAGERRGTSDRFVLKFEKPTN
jgi:predicted methyltransferase